MIETTFSLINYLKSIEVIRVAECVLAERLELELEKYGAKGAGSDGKNS